MRLIFGRQRVIDMVKPHAYVAEGGICYLMASWRSTRNIGPEYHWVARNAWKAKPNQTGGWLPGRWRLAGLRPNRRIIDPAVRYQPGIRQANEIRGLPGPKFFYPWDKRRPVVR